MIAGFGVSLALVAVETGLDYPLLRLSGAAEAGNEAVWLNRGAVALALIAWPVTALLRARGLGWTALALPVALGLASLFLESAAATLGLAAGVAAVLLALCHRRAGLAVTLAAGVLVFVAMPFAARKMHDHGWHRAEWLAASAQHRIEIWEFSVQRIAEKPLLGWGFDGSRHMESLYPDPSETGRVVAALHPHSAPLQIMLELGAVGAVIALALLWLDRAAARRRGRPDTAIRAGSLRRDSSHRRGGARHVAELVARPGGLRRPPGAADRLAERARLGVSVQHRHQLAPLALGEAAVLLIDRFARQHALDHVEPAGRERDRVHPVVAEGLVGRRHPAQDDLVEDHVGIGADLVLGVGVGPQRQEVQQVVQVDLPVELRVVVDRQRRARELAGEAGTVGVLLLAISRSR